jgi:hypothetical protein
LFTTSGCGLLAEGDEKSVGGYGMLQETATGRRLCYQLGCLIASPEARINCSGYLLPAQRAGFPWLRLSSGLQVAVRGRPCHPRVSGLGVEVTDQTADKRGLNFAPHLHFSTRIYNFSSWSQLRRPSNGCQERWAPRNAFSVSGIRFLVHGSNYSRS